MDTQKEIYRALRIINEASEHKKLKHNKSKEYKDSIITLQAYFDVGELAAIVLSIVVSQGLQNYTTSLNDICSHLAIQPLNIVDIQHELNKLEDKYIVYKQRQTYDFNKYEIAYYVFSHVIDGIRSHKLFNNKYLNCIDDYEFLAKVNELTTSHTDFESSMRLNVPKHFKRLFKQNSKLPLCELVSQFPKDEAFIITMLIYNHLNESPQLNLQNIVDNYITDESNRLRFKQRFYNEKTQLQAEGYCKLVQNEIEETTSIVLGQVALQELDNLGLGMTKPDKQESPQYKYRGANIIEHKSIKTKQLFYNDDDWGQIQHLKDALNEEQLKKVLSRMRERNLPQSLNILLSGNPGTGKTELCYQIARQTKRDVMMVDMSQVRTKWYGETEKRVQRIFNNYFHFSSENTRLPILLFNEADALLQQRVTLNQDTGGSAIPATNNTLQNIILQNMETSQQMLLVATTNFSQNMDKAFARRFLYKFNISKPDASTRFKIWQDRTSEFAFTEIQLKELASFEFNGAKIENIIRKGQINYITTGKLSFADIMSLCQGEDSDSNARKVIGFNG